MLSSASDLDLTIIGEKPWWLYDIADFPGFTREQIEAGLTVPACTRLDENEQNS